MQNQKIGSLVIFKVSWGTIANMVTITYIATNTQSRLYCTDGYFVSLSKKKEYARLKIINKGMMHAFIHFTKKF